MVSEDTTQNFTYAAGVFWHANLVYDQHAVEGSHTIQDLGCAVVES